MTNVIPRPRSAARARPLEAKLIFNPGAGVTETSNAQLAELLEALQAQRIDASVHMVRPESRLNAVARNALRRGTRLVIVSGGDGTVESVLDALVGTPATLGVVPTGTRNNVARSLGIPVDSVANSVALLRGGRRMRIDVGHAQCRTARRYFLEFCAAGLAPALYPAADDFQHGHLSRLPELLGTLLTHPASEIRLSLDDGKMDVTADGHLVVAANMPHTGPNLQIAPEVSFVDGRLDVLVYSNLSKLDLIGHAVQLAGSPTEDSRVDRYRARKMVLRAKPEMPVMADGFVLGNSPLTVTLRPRALNVMTGDAAPLPYPPASPANPEDDAHAEP